MPSPNFQAEAGLGDLLLNCQYICWEETIKDFWEYLPALALNLSDSCRSKGFVGCEKTDRLRCVVMEYRCSDWSVYIILEASGYLCRLAAHTSTDDVWWVCGGVLVCNCQSKMTQHSPTISEMTDFVWLLLPEVILLNISEEVELNVTGHALSLKTVYILTKSSHIKVTPPS